MKKIILVLAILTAPLFAQKILTVDEAIKLGLKNNFDIRIARNTAEIAQNNRGKGTAGFLPTLDIYGNGEYGQTETDTNSPFSFGSTTNRNWGGQAALSWTLFDGFKMFVDKTRYDELAQLGKDQARFNIESAVVGILQAYFNLVQQEQLLDVAQSTLEISEARLRKEEVRSELGGASSTDLLNARVSYNNDRSQLLNQQLRVDVARKDLNITLGRDPQIESQIVKDILIPPLDLSHEEILQLAQEQNSALAMARQDKKVADQNVHLNQSSLYPRLSISGNYLYNDRTTERESGSDILSQTQDLKAGLTLSWNLFNGFRNSIDVQNAKIEAKNKTIALQRAQNKLAGLVQEKYDTFLKRVQLAKLEEENTAAARQNLQRHKERYEIGTTTSLEFRDAQTNLVRAQATLINALYQARISRLEIDQIIGRIKIE